MRQGTTTYRVSVLVERPDGSCFYRWWSGNSVGAIRRKAWVQYRTEYPGSRVSFGTALASNSYGAH